MLERSTPEMSDREQTLFPVSEPLDDSFPNLPESRVEEFKFRNAQRRAIVVRHY